MTVAVYGASSSRVAPQFAETARELGRLLAGKGIEIVCGGGRAGLMAAVTDGALQAGGCVTGVIPRFMLERGWAHSGLSECVVTEDMHSRKAEMLRRADAVIALPGGIGTFEELFEAMTWRQLNLWCGHIVILNVSGYYDPLLAQLGRAEADAFMFPAHRALRRVATSPVEAVRMVTEPDNAGEFGQKII